MVRGLPEGGRDRFLLVEGQRGSRVGLGWRLSVSLRKVSFLHLPPLLLFRRFEGHRTVETSLAHLLLLFIYMDVIPLVLDLH